MTDNTAVAVVAIAAFVCLFSGVWVTFSLGPALIVIGALAAIVLLLTL